MTPPGLPPRIAIASRNGHKISEVRRICATWPVEWLTDGDAWPEVDEVGETYLDNALLKATAIAGEVGIPALSDDSGIEVDALGGAPGGPPRSASRCPTRRRSSTTWSRAR